MTQALNLANFANNLNTAGATTNSGLQNSSVTVTAGTGMSGGGAVALGSSVTLNNAGVTSIVAGTGISISGAAGAVTITNTGTSPYIGQKAQLFTSSGTFTVPSGVTAIKVTVNGGGGSTGDSLSNNGHAGGTSTFSTVSSTGGGGGDGAGPSQGVDGTTSGQALQMQPNTFSPYGSGGGSNYGNGGNARPAIQWFTGLTPASTITATVGAGGASGPYGMVAGNAGFVLVEW